MLFEGVRDFEVVSVVVCRLCEINTIQHQLLVVIKFLEAFLPSGECGRAQEVGIVAPISLTSCIGY